MKRGIYCNVCLPVCTFSFASDPDVGALEEFHRYSCTSVNRFEDLSQSHVLWSISQKPCEELTPLGTERLTRAHKW